MELVNLYKTQQSSISKDSQKVKYNLSQSLWNEKVK